MIEHEPNTAQQAPRHEVQRSSRSWSCHLSAYLLVSVFGHPEVLHQSAEIRRRKRCMEERSASGSRQHVCCVDSPESQGDSVLGWILL